MDEAPVSSAFVYEAFSSASTAACLRLFDRNRPDFFAPNERADHQDFIARGEPGYTVFRLDDRVVGAFGLFRGAVAGRGRLVWIMLNITTQGQGLGRQIMNEAARRAATCGATMVDIAASHLSAPFFARFGAVETTVTPDGWSPAMHRVDMEWPISAQRL